MPAMRGGRYNTQFGYHAARVSRQNYGSRPTGGSADKQLRQDRFELANQADALYRDSAIYRSLVDRFVDSVFGADGFTLDPGYTNGATSKAVAERWALFCEAPEVRGLFSWQDMERIALLSMVNGGDVGAIHTNVRKFQLTEWEEIGGTARTASSIDKKTGERWESGVLLDSLGKPKKFRIHERNAHGFVKEGKGRKIKAANFTFLAHRERFSQTRGVPLLASAFPMIYRLTDVCDSEAAAWQNLAKFALTITREGGPEIAYSESSPDSDGVDAGSGSTAAGGDSNQADADAADRVVEFEEAIIFQANPGESITSIDRNLPGKDFPESVRMFLRLIGMPLGMPLEVLLLDYSKTNYSAARAALEQAYRVYISMQRFLKRNWHTPLYRRWLRWEIEAKTLPRDPELLADARGEAAGLHKWNANEYPWIDALKEADAWSARISTGLATQTQALNSTHQDHGDWLTKRGEEVEAAIAKANEINEANPGANVDWRMFAGVEVSKTQGMQEPAPAQGEPAVAPEPVKEAA